MNWFEKMSAECIKRGAPQGWQVTVSEMLGTYPKYTHYRFEGAVYPAVMRGPRTGRPNYRKPVPGTKMTFVLSNEEVRSVP